MGLQEFVVKIQSLQKIIRNLGRRLCWMNEMAIRGNTLETITRSVEPIAEDGNLELVPRLLVVDDKKMIFDQLKDCIADTGWKLFELDGGGVGYLRIGVLFSDCDQLLPPDDAAIDLRRKLKTNPLSSRTPVLECW